MMLVFSQEEYGGDIVEGIKTRRETNEREVWIN